MPPRRSSRSTKASIEPTEKPPLPAKRKRGQTADPEAEEHEGVAKPPSRARRSTSAQPSATAGRIRTSTRPRGSLPDVAESGDEGEADSAPPVKKARPSLEPKEEEDSEFEEEKPKARRTALAKRGKPLTTGRKPVSASSRSGRASRTAPAPAVEEEHGEEEEPPVSEEDVKPSVCSRRTSGTRSTTSSSRATPDVDEDDDNAMQTSDDEPQPKPKKTAAPKKAVKASRSRKAMLQTVQSDDEGSGIEEEPHMETQGEPPAVTANHEEQEASAVEEEEEEETSLFDPPPIPAPSSLPQTMPEEPAGPKARLVIHKMALVNFKSYAGRQEIGPFHKSFSSIVGPNGSGKSNTIDALLFVFGYRASKMRQGKLSELIHNSARHPSLDNCSVEVHFREIIDLPGPDDFEVVPNSQLIVTRQAFKNNSSRYTINGKSSTYTEVQTLLKGRGIDLDHNRFLILQGEVESIAQMKPKALTEHDEGLLEYLEDIIGTSRFKEPIEESLVDMERLQEDRMAKLNRLRFVEKEKQALEAQKKEAEEYLKLKNEHTRAKSRLWQWILWQCFSYEAELEKKVDKHTKDLAAERERNQADIDHLEDLKKHYKDREAAYAEVEEAAAVALKELATREKEEVGLQERRKHAASKAKKLRKAMQEDTAAKQKAVRDLQENTDKIERKKKEADEHEANLAKEEKVLEGIRDSLKDKTQVFHDQIEAKQKELQPWTNKINAKQAEIDVASSERDALTKKAEALEVARKEAQDMLTSLSSDQTVKVREYGKLKETKMNLQRDIHAAERRVQESRADVDEWRKKAGTSRQKVDEAKASQADNRSRNSVLDSLTRLQQSGRVSGFHGRLGALGTIPDKYDVAVSTAAPGLHNMIVDRVEQGQACIEYLRTQNIGRASFMVLEKLTNINGMAKIQTPENVPRLFDLIQPKDPKFAPAFYKAVTNTLVADDMDQANRIAYGAKRWKVVTLAGQLIETSGTMSGGGGAPARGSMSSKLAADAVSPQVLRTYEEASQDAARKLDQATQELRAAEDQFDRLKNSGPQMDMAFQKLGLDIENTKQRISEAEKRVDDINARSGPNKGDLTRIKSLETDIAQATAELERLQEKSAKVENAIKELEKKILDIGGSRLLKQKSTVEGLKLHITLANDEITKAEVAKAKAAKDSARLDGTIQTNTVGLQDADAELEELDGNLEDLTAYVTDLRAKVEDAQDAANTSKEDLDKLKAEVDDKDQEIAEFRKKELEIQQQLDDAAKEAAENDKIITHWQTEHDKLLLEEIDESDDDDDDDENPDATNPAQAAEQPKGETREDDSIKPEPDETRLNRSKPKDKASSQELHVYRPDELARFKKRDLVASEQLLDEKVKNAKPDLTVLKEYRRREEEFMNRAKDLDAVTELRDAQKAKYDGLRKQRLDEFMSGFNLISLKLKEMYQMITLGGNAELELVDSMDPFSEGIIFSVMPPKKSWKNISNLSGGEKTLSSLALVFALHVFKPTPLYFMDEIDAALDFRNVSIVANYIKDRTKNAQFIIISLRNDMFELSHRLIGIYKTANATRSISIDNHALVAPPIKA
ncbi:hypothetical protein H0H87_000945 [Tephrocybe sp. NHM501043]|nr:hypothetical protein H0H87_000945 [Tephrocybe sp. NHM501043]